MPTILEFLADPYRVETEAVVIERSGDRIALDRTIFYPGIGISPADSGSISFEDGRNVGVKRTVWDAAIAGRLQHVCADLSADVQPGMRAVLKIDWPSRYAAMRIHTALHLVSIGFPYPMVDGLVKVGWGQAIFEVDRTGVEARELAAIVADLVEQRLPVNEVWLKPPIEDRRINIRPFEWPGFEGLVRAMKIDEIDIQPCDGLHVLNTQEASDVELVDLSHLGNGFYRAEVRLPDR